MRVDVELEDIEAMRLEVGIDDISLRDDIRALRAGDLVKLTAKVANRPPPGEPLLVRVTRVGARAFHGKLTHAARLSRLAAGSAVRFTAAHVHSVVKEPADAPSPPRRWPAGRGAAASAARAALTTKEIG